MKEENGIISRENQNIGEVTKKLSILKRGVIKLEERRKRGHTGFGQGREVLFN